MWLGGLGIGKSRVKLRGGTKWGPQKFSGGIGFGARIKKEKGANPGETRPPTLLIGEMDIGGEGRDVKRDPGGIRD